MATKKQAPARARPTTNRPQLPHLPPLPINPAEWDRLRQVNARGRWPGLSAPPTAGQLGERARCEARRATHHALQIGRAARDGRSRFTGSQGWRGGPAVLSLSIPHGTTRDEAREFLDGVWALLENCWRGLLSDPQRACDFYAQQPQAAEGAAA